MQHHIFNPDKLIYSVSKHYPTHTKHIVYKKPYPKSSPRLPSSSKNNQKLKIAFTEIKKKIDNHKQIEIIEYLKKDRALRRAKSEIKDIILSNKFDLFCTFTFAKDRQDIQKCKQKMQSWLKVQRQTYGKFSYVIVPEFHRDGISLHFHALFYNYNGPLSFSGRLQRGRKVYNFDDNEYGFTTAVKIKQDKQNMGRVSSYVTKYITKDMPLFSGKKRYWCSQALARPTRFINEDIPPIDLFTARFDTDMYTILNFPKFD